MPILEKYLVSIPTLAIFTFCLIGCGLHSFFVGRQDGIQQTIEYLVEQGVLQVEEADEE